MDTVGPRHQLRQIERLVLENAFLHDAPGDYRQGVLDALAEVAKVVDRAQRPAMPVVAEPARVDRAA